MNGNVCIMKWVIVGYEVLLGIFLIGVGIVMGFSYIFFFIGFIFYVIMFILVNR